MNSKGTSLLVSGGVSCASMSITKIFETPFLLVICLNLTESSPESRPHDKSYERLKNLDSATGSATVVLEFMLL